VGVGIGCLRRLGALKIAPPQNLADRTYVPKLALFKYYNYLNLLITRGHNQRQLSASHLNAHGEGYGRECKNVLEVSSL
jgi:hypothetical protein